MHGYSHLIGQYKVQSSILWIIISHSIALIICGDILIVAGLALKYKSNPVSVA